LTQNQNPLAFEPMSACGCMVDLMTRRKSLSRSIAIWPLSLPCRPSAETVIEGLALSDWMVAAFLLCCSMIRPLEIVSLAIGGSDRFRPEVPALQPVAAISATTPRMALRRTMTGTSPVEPSKATGMGRGAILVAKG
jgi:hypothetical protein